jgi:hypothetical protein
MGRIGGNRVNAGSQPRAGGCGLNRTRRVQGQYTARNSSAPEHDHTNCDKDWMLLRGSLRGSDHRPDGERLARVRCRNAVIGRGHLILLYATDPAPCHTVRGHSRIADYNAAVAQTEATVERIKNQRATEQATTSTAP